MGKIYEIKSEEIERLFEKLRAECKDLGEEIVLGAYLADEINLSKAAELLGLHPIELRRFFLKQGIPIKLGASSPEGALAEAKALETLGKS
jgi:predicted HTH domain antitoxin